MYRIRSKWYDSVDCNLKAPPHEMVLGNTMVWRKLLHILLRAAKHLLALSIFSRVNIFGYFLYDVTTVLEDWHHALLAV